jgi:phage I-like protein
VKFEPGQSGNPAGKWQPGQSGNPNGRPKSKPFKDALQRLLAKADGQELENIAAALMAKASIGDVAAIKEVADRMDGKVPQAVIGDNEHDPISVIITGVKRDGD